MTNFATFLDYGSSGRRAMVSCAMIVHILSPRCCLLCMTQDVSWSLARKGGHGDQVKFEARV